MKYLSQYEATSFGHPPEVNLLKLLQLTRKVIKGGTQRQSISDRPSDSVYSDPQAMSEYLDNLYIKAVEACQSRLNETRLKPNEVAYDMVEEFRDYVVHSKTHKSEWREFLGENNSIFQPPSDDSQIKKQWDDLIDRLSLTSEDLNKCIDDYFA